MFFRGGWRTEWDREPLIPSAERRRRVSGPPGQAGRQPGHLMENSEDRYVQDTTQWEVSEILLDYQQYLSQMDSVYKITYQQVSK